MVGGTGLRLIFISLRRFEPLFLYLNLDCSLLRRQTGGRYRIKVNLE